MSVVVVRQIVVPKGRMVDLRERPADYQVDPLVWVYRRADHDSATSLGS